MNQFILGLLALVFSFHATASIVFSPGLSYSSNTLDQATPAAGAGNGESSNLRADVRLGYVFNMGLYFGAMYQINNLDDSINNPSSYNAGPTIGYYHPGGFYGLVTYHLIGESKDVVAAGDKFIDAKGPQVDLGWVFPLASSFSIGPQVTWRQLEYGNYDDGTGTEVASDRKSTEIRPYLSLWFMF